MSASTPITVRAAAPADAGAIRAVHTAAFPAPAEADLVERIVANGTDLVSLVAEDTGRVVGHVLFSPVTVDHLPSEGLGLAPVAVRPEFQRRGVGAALVRAGLEACAARGVGFVVVLGEPGYYGRFGFAEAARFGLGNEYGVVAEFMVTELRPGGLPRPGTVRYGPEFAGLG